MTVYTLDGVSPEIARSAWIARDAAVIGDVLLGEETSVWFGAVLRGDNEPIRVGRRTNIQEHAVIHTDPGFPAVIGEGCTIGHRAVIHGCEVGGNSLIGMGAIVLNGARIGVNCLIGAGALVTENKVVPPNSLVVGAPGRVVRELDEAAIEALRRSAAHYAENARRFAQGLAAL
jgi:carbonic anhydrase/acetyltransferase-like protein (isoleucine patch superfamily)